MSWFRTECGSGGGGGALDFLNDGEWLGGQGAEGGDGQQFGIISGRTATLTARYMWYALLGIIDTTKTPTSSIKMNYSTWRGYIYATFHFFKEDGTVTRDHLYWDGTGLKSFNVPSGTVLVVFETQPNSGSTAYNEYSIGVELVQ